MVTAIEHPSHRLKEAGIIVRCIDHDCRVGDDAITDCGELGCPECGISPVWFHDEIAFCEDCGWRSAQ